VIADCTEKNPNVLYKRVILISRSEKDVPSDIKHFDYIELVYILRERAELIENVGTFLEAHLSRPPPALKQDAWTSRSNLVRSEDLDSIICRGVKRLANGADSYYKPFLPPDNLIGFLPQLPAARPKQNYLSPI
jgi:hypothetical protein